MNQRPRTIEEQVSLLRAKGMEFDNLSEAKVISEIEDAFDIQIETEEGLNTVGDLVAYVEEKTK